MLRLSKSYDALHLSRTPSVLLTHAQPHTSPIPKSPSPMHKSQANYPITMPKSQANTDRERSSNRSASSSKSRRKNAAQSANSSSQSASLQPNQATPKQLKLTKQAARRSVRTAQTSRHNTSLGTSNSPNTHQLEMPNQRQQPRISSVRTTQTA